MNSKVMHISACTTLDQSYPVELLQFLKSLGTKWVEFASYIGFTREDVQKLKDVSTNETSTPIQNFSKLWRMPDLTSGENDKVFDEVLQAAKITLGRAIYMYIAVYSAFIIVSLNVLQTDTLKYVTVL